MKTKNILKLTAAVLFSAGVMAVWSYFLLVPRLGLHAPVDTTPDTAFGWKFPVAKFPSTGSSQDQVAYSDIRDPGGIPKGLPVRLKIPVIGVDSAIEDALITPDGRMDVPVGSVNVAWFALGPHPGQVGSAVIGGHFGIINGVPFVFYNLHKLTGGDTIYIINDKGETLSFVVRSIKSFDRNADATTVFTSDDGLAHLNLITCEGVWNKINGSYPERRVVFTDLVPSGSSAVPEKATTVISSLIRRSLSIGTRGTDVVALQNELEQKGFLTMPAGVAKGYFGALTRSAVAKYQASVGLPPIGVFGPLTLARFISEEVAVKPALPITALSLFPVARSGSMALSQSFVRSAKSLYATPVEGLITFLLLISIVFVTYKVTRRGL